MPYPNEHAARQAPPENFERFRRGQPEGWPSGLHAIYGVKSDGSSQIQSIRAESATWTEGSFRRWLEGHGFKTDIEAATTKDEETEELPGYMVAALRRGLEAHEAGRTGDGIRPRTVREARSGVKSGRWPRDKWIRARAWFARHESDWEKGEDDKAGEESPGFAAWLLWGDADGRGRKKVEDVAEAFQIEKAAPALLPPPVPNRDPYPYSGVIELPGGFRVLVETAAGETRSGVDPDGNDWSIEMSAHYGEIEGTKGADGDALDVFVGPDISSPLAFCMAIKVPGESRFDEDKLFVGFQSREEAEACFDASYDRDDLKMELRELDYDELSGWIVDKKNEGERIEAGRVVEQWKATLGIRGFSEAAAPIAESLASILSGELVTSVKMVSSSSSPGPGIFRFELPDAVSVPSQSTDQDGGATILEVDVIPSDGLISKLKAAKSGGKMPENNRLTDIDVGEVSIVDAAANGKKFAVIKSLSQEKNMDPNEEKTTEPTGEATTETKSEGGEAAGTDAPSTDGAAADGATNGSEEATEKAEGDLGMGESVDTPVSNAMLSEKVAAMRAALANIASGSPADIKARLGAIRDMAWDIQESAAVVLLTKSATGNAASDELKGFIKSVDERIADLAKSDGETGGAPDVGADAGAGAGSVEDTEKAERDRCMKAAAELVSAFKGDRVKAIAAVTSVGDELIKAAGETKAADPLAMIGAGLAAIVQELRDMKGSMGRGPAPATAAKAEGTDAPAEDTEKAEMAETIKNLNSTVGDLVGRIAKMEKRTDRPASNGASGQPVDTKKSNDSWPADMAAATK